MLSNGIERTLVLGSRRSLKVLSFACDLVLERWCRWPGDGILYVISEWKGRKGWMVHWMDESVEERQTDRLDTSRSTWMQSRCPWRKMADM